ncbi:uncharacterized protein DNG_00367 [Cephalotrichum gorgonifer]|uniref:Uncharacterized protein n=1 Tax=Cephalotrichum gorgonifer TaxID=2041049 RepID=A0AAE8MQJ1_9PEZI|nr:uncharacterized protein DNG_00367 [Cephalotrichum gorgonifer]
MPEVQRPHTPPASDPEDIFSLSLSPTSIQTSSPPHIDLPTPGPSPDMSPVADASIYSNLQAIGDLNAGHAKESGQGGEGSEKSTFAHSTKSQRSSFTYPSDSSSGSVILKEPTLDDFLDLSDDDIAEEQTETHDEMEGRLRHASLTPRSSMSRSRAASLLTLPPPLYSRPATSAAFEAARIAGRHNFDLVYVVNLWPDRDNGLDPRSTPTACSYESRGRKSRMTGRFLAAYGLSTVKSPFRISTMVHKRILQADGWTEYRNDEAERDDFARGYACTFYRGQYGGPRAPSGAIGPKPASEPWAENIDRGIVFAAYRKPNSDGSKSAADCSKAQLSTIYRDAEALVEMLIDIHMANRLRAPPGPALYSDETGPMPTHKPMRGGWS